MKNTLEGTDSRLDYTEEWISELEDRVVAIINAVCQIFLAPSLLCRRQCMLAHSATCGSMRSNDQFGPMSWKQK